MSSQIFFPISERHEHQMRALLAHKKNCGVSATREARSEIIISKSTERATRTEIARERHEFKQLKSGCMYICSRSLQVLPSGVL